MNKSKQYRTLDDLLNATYIQIFKEGNFLKSKRGNNIEIINFSATLLNPRARTSMSLDRKLVRSKFAEFAWYLSKDESRDYITPYIDAYTKEDYENNKILGAYGPKIFGAKEGHKSQFERVINQLNNRKATKQAYISISDIDDYKLRVQKFSSPPCTIGLHFYVREDKLHLTSYMRSNDAYLGLPHDLFCFTMLQELVGCRTAIELGTYTHITTSMHIYKEHIEQAKSYVEEGLQEPLIMPKIENCDELTLKYVSQEFDIKNSSKMKLLDNYWKDYVLFSNKHFDINKNKEIYLKQFKNDEMRLIANNSLVK